MLFIQKSHKDAYEFIMKYIVLQYCDVLTSSKFYQQVNQLTGMVDNLLGMVRKTGASELTKLSAAEQEVMLKMEQAVQDVKAVSASRQYQADDALRASQLSERQLSSANVHT